jgi:aminoglycoside phosphotransferase (APT) family kinase protein
VEAAVLPVLAPMLPFNVPVPAFFCPQAPGLPFGAIGYPRLAGQPCQPPTATAATARDLGIFLAVLHHADARRLPALPGQDDVWLGWRNLRAASGPVLGSRLTNRENQRLSQWWDQFLGDRRMQYYRPAVRHGDLWYGNLLIRPSGAIAAVLDWEAVAVADPAQDLALARYLGPSFAAAVLGAYSDHGGACDEHLLHRIERHWELREFTGIPLAAAAGDDDEVSECIAKLRSGPVLSQ